MSEREEYAPGDARGAEVQKDGDKWTLVLVRELRHSPEKVWQALTEPAHLREWAPFDADGGLGQTGNKVKLSTVGALLAAKAVIEEADHVKLSGRDSLRVLDLLENPPKPNAKLLAAARALPNRS
jgi:hypothetical protein